MFFFCRKKLIKCYTVDEKNRICSILKKNNIEYKTVIKGISMFKRIGQIFWFNVYVHKNDYLRSKAIMDEIYKQDIQKK